MTDIDRRRDLVMIAPRQVMLGDKSMNDRRRCFFAAVPGKPGFVPKIASAADVKRLYVRLSFPDGAGNDIALAFRHGDVLGFLDTAQAGDLVAVMGGPFEFQLF